MCVCVFFCRSKNQNAVSTTTLSDSADRPAVACAMLALSCAHNFAISFRWRATIFRGRERNFVLEQRPLSRKVVGSDSVRRFVGKGERGKKKNLVGRLWSS